jgi:cobalt-zinc-cadmium efflux system membrane fusion protein
VVLPSAAVLIDGEKSFCFVQESPNRFRRVPISVGAQHGGKVPVLSGLSRGDHVVTGGSLMLASFFHSGAGG